MKKTITIIAFILLATVARADISSSVKTMTIEGAARAVAMGDAFTSITGEAFSSAYNPAGPFGIEHVSASVGYNTLWENTRMETGYISFHKKSAVMTLGLKYWANDHLEWRDAPTLDYVEGSAHDLSAKFGASFELDETTVIGFNVGIIYEKIKEYDGTAFNFDIGFISNMFSNVQFGAAIINFGSTLSLRDESFDLPTTYRGGVSYQYSDLKSALDVVYLESDMHIHAGLEYEIRKIFYLRGGYRTGYDSSDISAGFGVKKRNIRIDYAFLPYKDNLNDTHIFNFTFEL